MSLKRPPSGGFVIHKQGLLRVYKRFEAGFGLRIRFLEPVVKLVFLFVDAFAVIDYDFRASGYRFSGSGLCYRCLFQIQRRWHVSLVVTLQFRQVVTAQLETGLDQFTLLKRNGIVASILDGELRVFIEFAR